MNTFCYFDKELATVLVSAFFNFFRGFGGSGSVAVGFGASSSSLPTPRQAWTMPSMPQVMTMRDLTLHYVQLYYDIILYHIILLRTKVCRAVSRRELCYADVATSCDAMHADC